MGIPTTPSRIISFGPFRIRRLTVSGGVDLSGTGSVLAFGSTYAVLIDTDAVADPYGNFFSGILDTAGWRFTTKAAELLVYEGFDCAGADQSTMENQVVLDEIRFGESLDEVTPLAAPTGGMLLIVR